MSTENLMFYEKKKKKKKNTQNCILYFFFQTSRICIGNLTKNPDKFTWINYN